MSSSGSGGWASELLIDAEEGQYLLPQHATLQWRSDLLELEAVNLAAGVGWLDSQAVTRERLLTQSFQHELHRRMYGDVWAWAGVQRTHENNIGVAPEQIADRWEQLLGNAGYWLDHGVFDPDEACIRYYFHQREIQPFHDGNSRLAREVTIKLAELVGLAATGAPRYRFGEGGTASSVRSEYLKAVELARTGNFAPLVALARRGAD